jgi:hypothetical protein
MTATFGDIATWIIAGATVVYTIATIALVHVTRKNVRLVERYTHLTQGMVEEAREGRRAGIRPILVPVFGELEGDDQFFQGQKLYWGVENVGNGPALDVVITLRYGDKQERRLERPMIRVGERRMVRDGEGYRARVDLRESTDYTLALTGSFRDLDGKRYEANSSLPVRDWWGDPLASEPSR